MKFKQVLEKELNQIQGNMESGVGFIALGQLNKKENLIKALLKLY